MYKGLCATWVGVFPYVGLKFYFYELFKNKTKEYYKWDNIGESLTFLYGGIAAFVATTFTYPLDVVRRRR